MRDSIFDMHKYLTDNKVTVGYLFKILCDYIVNQENPKGSEYDLFTHIYVSHNFDCVTTDEEDLGSTEKDQMSCDCQETA